MSDRRRWTWRIGAAGALTVGLMAVSAGSALAVPDYMWRNGYFTVSRAPVYEKSVDGWWCHTFGACRSAERNRDDPRAQWYGGRSQRIQIECSLGEYVKIHRGAHEGWVLASHVRATARPVPCYATDF